MPVSNLWHAGAVIHFVEAAHRASPVRRALDVGVGTGSYGWLLRQALEVGEQRWRREDWRTRVEGIEIFEQYRNPMWDYVYDDIHLGDVRQILPRLQPFDVIIACDVLEHFTREDARALISQLLGAGKTLIATTPNREFPQEAWGGNEAERHLSLLDASDFESLAAEVSTGVTTCYVATRDPVLRRHFADAAQRMPRVVDAKKSLFAKLRFQGGRVLRMLGLRRD